jgi:hypothetical protein
MPGRIGAMNIADLHEFLAIERYHHVTVIVPSEHYEAIVGRVGKEGPRHTILGHAFVPQDKAIVLRTHKVEAYGRELMSGFRMAVDTPDAFLGIPDASRTLRPWLGPTSMF